MKKFSKVFFVVATTLVTQLSTTGIVNAATIKIIDANIVVRPLVPAGTNALILLNIIPANADIKYIVNILTNTLVSSDKYTFQ